MPLPKSPSRPARTQIENLWPVLDCGRYPVKRTLGQPVTVWADVFRDGHEILGAELKYRPAGSRTWLREPMEADAADRWSATFLPTELGRWQFTVEAWSTGPPPGGASSCARSRPDRPTSRASWQRARRSSGGPR